MATTAATLNIGLLFFYPSALGTLAPQPGTCSGSEFKSNNALFWLVLISMFVVNIAMMMLLAYYILKVAALAVPSTPTPLPNPNPDACFALDHGSADQKQTRNSR